MKKVKGDSDREELRKRAEAILQRRRADILKPSKLTPEETQRLILELQVHQIELELQNEELRQAQLELEQARDKYSDLYDFAPLGYFTISNEGMILEANLTGATMLGVERGSMIGNLFSKLINRDDQDVFYLYRKKLFETKNRESCELRLVKKDGSEFHAQLECIVTGEKEGSSQIRVAVSDITERKRAEDEKEKLAAQLQQARKMEAIGTLAGGIAHNFNNILGVVLGNTELAMYEIPEWSPAQHSLKEVRGACLRARDMVRQILTFSRQDEQRQKPVKLGAMVEESLGLLRSSIPTTIDIHKHLLSKSDTVLADATQINQVLINLCTNAAHAMEEAGGILEVRVEDRELDKDSVRQYRDLEPGNYVRLTVSDTGHGMEPEMVGRIFDPYFTTKEVGKGAGMGLAVVDGIVKSHGGWIAVDSEPGKGSRFHVLLPALEVEAEPEPESLEAVPTGTERVLIVDDEQPIANLLGRMLERLGYTVVTRLSSREALDVFRQEPDGFDLMITDMAMLRMTGDQLAAELRKMRPGIPVILATGHGERIDEAKAKAIGIRAFVMKPFLKREIAECIRKVLDEK